MSDYAWEKFHLAAEMLREDGDKRDKLAEAFSQEIGLIKDEDIPTDQRKSIGFIFEKLSLPANVETLTRMAHPHHAVRHLGDDTIDEIIKIIFELESVLKVPSAPSGS